MLAAGRVSGLGERGAGWWAELVWLWPSPEGWTHFKLLVHFLRRWELGRGRPEWSKYL